MKVSLDELDHKILKILESDGRAPAKYIAEQLSVNEVTVSKRLAKIIEGGFCKIIAIADFEKCGFDHLLPVGIRVHGEKLEEVANILSLNAIPTAFPKPCPSGPVVVSIPLI